MHREFRLGRSAVYHVNVTPAIPAAAVAVDVQVMQDFKALRKAKRRPALTQTEITALTAEGNKAGLTLTDVLKTCVVRGWTRFEATWLPAVKAAPAPYVEPPKPANASTVSSGISHLAALRSAITASSASSLSWAHAAVAKKQAGEYVAQQVVRSACAALKMDYRIAFN